MDGAGVQDDWAEGMAERPRPTELDLSSGRLTNRLVASAATDFAFRVGTLGTFPSCVRTATRQARPIRLPRLGKAKREGREVRRRQLQSPRPQAAPRSPSASAC